MKKKIENAVLKLKDEFHGYVKELYDNPEIGNAEFFAAKLLTSVLSKYGFEAKTPYVLETDFIGIYDSKKPGPKVGFLCEYDALPDIGHGCGHNLIGVTSILGAIALKEVIDEIGGSIHVFGTPAEENFGGKVSMCEKNVFKDIDIAMMYHPAAYNNVGGRSQAIIPIRFEFHGQSAHGCNPYGGKSALDAAVLTYQSISMMRQFVKPDTFIHGVITNGGTAANVIPPYACLDYYFRAPTISYAEEMVEKAKNIATSCASAAGVKVVDSIYECIYEDTKINYTIAKKLKEIMIDQGLETSDVDENPVGSSDVGATSYQCPTIQGFIKICDEDVLGHTTEFASCTISETGKNALIKGATSLALLGLETIINKEFLKEIKEEFNK